MGVVYGFIFHYLGHVLFLMFWQAVLLHHWVKFCVENKRKHSQLPSQEAQVLPRRRTFKLHSKVNKYDSTGHFLFFLIFLLYFFKIHIGTRVWGMFKNRLVLSLLFFRMSPVPEVHRKAG